jgi:hypothetical protein
MLNLLRNIVIAAAVAVVNLFTTANRYVPEIKITTSEDGGKTYTNNLKSIQKYKDIYVKCEVSVRANGLWRQLLSRVIDFTIKYPTDFTLYDYTGVKVEVKAIEKAAKAIEAKAKTIKETAKIIQTAAREIEKEAKAVTEKSTAAATFSVMASNNPKKNEIIFKRSKDNDTENIMNGKDYELTFYFEPPICKKVHDKTVTLRFIPWLN